MIGIPTEIEAGIFRAIMTHVEELCDKAKRDGFRVAVSKPDIVQNSQTLSYSLIINHEFLGEGETPSLGRECVVYGPWE